MYLPSHDGDFTTTTSRILPELSLVTLDLEYHRCAGA